MFKDKSKIIVFSDMDGTLLSSDKTICKRNYDAIERLRACGGIFVVSTGRVIQATRHYFEPIKLDCPVILCNGGMIYDCAENKVKWSKYLDEDKARKMIAELLEKFPQACAEICRPDSIYDVNINDTERYHWEITKVTDAIVVDSLDDVPSGQWCKVLFAMPEEYIEDFSKYSAELEYAESVEFVTSSSVFHEMLPKNCSKGEAMKMLMEVYNFDGYTSVAAGDFYNDLEMLRSADFAACPSNAIDEVKAVCDYVCTRECSEGAIAEIIDYVLKA